ncbi:MAG TPA: IPT/TIG domain-containing protein, partial [Thermoanaerobaculia bacterium]|nr:IPT/TIG domain-containing protein [Thermoanaerobaculia bacterium]
PQIVLRARATDHPILVLEDVGYEMRPWRRRVSALLSGLETRGVPVDRWRFHAGAGQVFRDPGAPPLTLKQLFRLRAESPLLVISAGEGLLEGRQGRLAPWVEALSGWRYRAWLHPVTDPAWWRPALREIPVQAWPMTPEGVMAAARQLVHGETGRPERETARAQPQRGVSPLDIERLRWLLTLAPRRDPDLAELLRQRFCPHVPPAALLEALDAPPLLARPGVGPSAEEVHGFLADLLASSEPRPETAAHARWRLDRALQEIRIPGREKVATHELIDLAQGPLAAEVVSAVERETGSPAKPLRQRVLRQAFSRAGAGEDGWRWSWPDRTEIAATLVCLGILGTLLPAWSSFQKKAPLSVQGDSTATPPSTDSRAPVRPPAPEPPPASPKGTGESTTDVPARSVPTNIEGPVKKPFPQKKPGKAPSTETGPSLLSASSEPAPPVEQKPANQPPSIQSLEPDVGLMGKKMSLTFSGANFDPQTTVTFSPPGINVSSCEAPTSVELRCEIEISRDAKPGPRDVTVINPDKQYQSYSGLFTVTGTPTAGAGN